MNFDRALCIFFHEKRNWIQSTEPTAFAARQKQKNNMNKQAN